MPKQTNGQHQPFRSWLPWINPPKTQRQISQLPSSSQQPPSQSKSPSPDRSQVVSPSASPQPPAQFKSPSPNIPPVTTPSQPPPGKSETPASSNLHPPPSPTAEPQSEKQTKEASSQPSQPQATSMVAQPPLLQPATPATSQRPVLPSSTSQSSSQSRLGPQLPPTTQKASHPISLPPSPPPPPTSSQVQQITQAVFGTPLPPENASQSKEASQANSRLVSETLPSSSQPKSQWQSLPGSTSQSSSQLRPRPQLPPTTQKTSHSISLPPIQQPSSPATSSQVQQSTQAAFTTPSPTRNASQSKEASQANSRLVSETLSSPSQPKSTPLKNQPELKSASKLANAHFLGKTAHAEPSALVNPTQSETKLEGLQGNITKGEQKQDFTFTSSLNAETEIDDIRRGKPTRKPETAEEMDATQPTRSEEKSEAIRKKPKPQAPQRQDAKALNAESKETVDWKESEKETDLKSTRIYPNPGRPVKEVRLSEIEQPEHQTMVHKIEPLRNSSTGKETKITISSLERSSASHEENDTLQKEIEDGISRLVQNLDIRNSRKPGSEQNTSIITLAGDNKGAIMHVGPKLMIKENAMHNDRDYSINHEAISDGRRGLKEKSRCSANNPSVNCNIQSINNSLLQNSICSAGNPGVHLAFSTKPIDTVNLRDRKGSPETYKDESRTNLMQKITYEPTIRRRCLRGLFMESSESDEENPKKPRRHGCHFSCEDKQKAKVHQNGSSNARNDARNE